MVGPMGASWEGQEERAQLNGGAEPRLQGVYAPPSQAVHFVGPAQPATCWDMRWPAATHLPVTYERDASLPEKKR